MVQKEILEEEVNISKNKSYGVLKKQSKKLTPYINKKVILKIFEAKE